MKINLPVTNVERRMRKGQMLVSKTDLKGVITYANDAFAEISGFSQAELVGTSHNIVRHPDMPAEVFQDLWDTVKDGRPWRGIVKNRTKEGDHYWVKALVVPIYKQGVVQGYMSVRTEATRQEIDAADRLYQAVREKRASLQKRFDVMKLAFRIPFNARYVFFVSFMAAFTVAAGLAGLAGMKGLTTLIALGGVALSAGSAIFMIKTLSVPLKEVVTHFDRIAQGDLDNDIDVTRPDEAGRVLASLAATQVHLRVMIDEIRLSVETLERPCADLEAEVENVSSHSQAQTDSIMQVTSAMEEVSVSVSEVARNAEGAADAARDTLRVVNEGNERMSQSLTNTDHVVAAVQASSEGIDRLSGSISNVGTVTRMIKDIADQTNLLALNAAIEAARAGEHGRGFAVVADEVRKLAERTARSTEEIDRMVDEIQATTTTTVESMKRAAERVHQGRALIGETYDSFGKITQASTEVTRMSSHIADAAKEQSSATEAVAKNTEQMSELVERNTASIKQVEQAVGSLRQTAGQLHELLSHFSA